MAEAYGAYQSWFQQIYQFDIRGANLDALIDDRIDGIFALGKGIERAGD